MSILTNTGRDCLLQLVCGPVLRGSQPVEPRMSEDISSQGPDGCQTLLLADSLEELVVEPAELPCSQRQIIL